MIAIPLGMGLGCLLGGAAAGALGGSFGIIVGGIGGALIGAVVDQRRRAPLGTPLAREEHRILCVPRGQIAQATFVRDATNGRWLDVERCSLCAEGQAIQCERRCLPLIRGALPPQQHPVAANVAIR